MQYRNLKLLTMKIVKTSTILTSKIKLVIAMSKRQEAGCSAGAKKQSVLSLNHNLRLPTYQTDRLRLPVAIGNPRNDAFYK
jgi:hypothetical protein